MHRCSSLTVIGYIHKIFGRRRLIHWSIVTGPDLGDAKRGVPEQAGAQGLRRPLIGCRDNDPVGGWGGNPQTLQNSSICNINLWPLLASHKLVTIVLLFV